MTLPLRLVPDRPAAPQPSHPGAALPLRPRLRPDRAVLWRSASAVQLGSDPAAAVVLDRLDPATAALFRGLDGSRRAEDLVSEAIARGADPAIVTDLLHDLQVAGLLSTPEPSEPHLAAEATSGSSVTGAGNADRALALRAQATVLVRGAGRVGVALACLLAAGGVGCVPVLADGLVAGIDTGTGLLRSDVRRPRAEAAAVAVARAAPGVRSRARPRLHPDLVVLAGAEVVDPALAWRLVTSGHAHLPVRVREGIGLVGPLVLPGWSGCLRCLERDHAQSDPDWPLVAAQLTLRDAPAPVTVAAATAALAADQVLALLDAPAAPAGAEWASPPSLGAVVEIDTRRARVRRRPAPARPDCPCAAPQWRSAHEARPA